MIHEFPSVVNFDLLLEGIDYLPFILIGKKQSSFKWFWKMSGQREAEQAVGSCPDRVEVLRS